MRNLQIKITENGNGLVTKEFAKQANIFGTPEYRVWREFKKENKRARMVTKNIKRNPDKKTCRNMTYKNIEVFINAQDNAQNLLEEFQKQLELAQIQKSPYHYVVDWFVKKFPNYTDHEAFAA